MGTAAIRWKIRMIFQLSAARIGSGKANSAPSVSLSQPKNGHISYNESHLLLLSRPRSFPAVFRINTEDIII